MTANNSDPRDPLSHVANVYDAMGDRPMSESKTDLLFQKIVADLETLGQGLHDAAAISLLGNLRRALADTQPPEPQYEVRSDGQGGTGIYRTESTAKAVQRPAASLTEEQIDNAAKAAADAFHGYAVWDATGAGDWREDWRKAARAALSHRSRPATDALSSDRASAESPEAAGAGDRALDLLAFVFDLYEDGDQVYEEPAECGGYMGHAVRIGEPEFSEIADLLNKHRPRPAAPEAQPEREVGSTNEGLGIESPPPEGEPDSTSVHQTERAGKGPEAAI